MKTFKYIIDGKEYQVEITDVVDNKAQVTVNGKDFQVEMEAQPEAEKKTVTPLPQSDEKVEIEPSTTGQVNTVQAIKAPLPCYYRNKGISGRPSESWRYRRSIGSHEDGK